MTDIVERLRDCWLSEPVHSLVQEAADEIERLRSVLKPFAKAADGFDSYNIKDPEEWYAYSGVSTRHSTTGAITVGDLRRARAALAQGGE